MKTYLYSIIRAFALCLIGGAMASCEYIHDDLSLCDHYLYFTYTYNMKFADAFRHEIDCQQRAKTAELFIFDNEGKFLSSRSLSTEELIENRIKLNLEPGDYQLLAWAGLNDTDYTWTKPSLGESIDQWQMAVKAENNVVSRELLGLFQGKLHLTIPAGGETDTEFPLVKNTNKIRFVLIDANTGTGLKADDFTVRVTTHNRDLDADNQLVSEELQTEWRPYYQQIERVGVDEQTALQTVCVELNTLRLLEDSKTKLRLSHKGETHPFLQVDLTDFLLLTKMESHDIEAQEYLDRQDEYTVIVYLDIVGGKAHCLEIIVNDWTIRLDDVNLGGKEDR